MLHQQTRAMNQVLPTPKAPGFLCLTVSVITCLTLLVNMSFKIVSFNGMMFSIHSLLCPVIAALYLLALRKCTMKEQRHLLNISLISLYAFCIGVYILINLPTAEHMWENPVYQIVFDDIQKKFFAITIAFVLGFYLPHILFCNKKRTVLSSPAQCLLLALFSGFMFFALDFFLLFSGAHLHNIHQIILDSILIASFLLLFIGVIYLSLELKYPRLFCIKPQEQAISPLCYYLSCGALVIMLICLACEYRIVVLVNSHWILAASALFFPITLAISTLVGELWGYKVNLKLGLMIISTQVMVDILLSGIVALPSPGIYSSSSFYNYIMLRRLPATFLTLSATFISNAVILHYLKRQKLQRALRILIANICANSLLCLIDYSLLFGGIYSCEQIISLVVNAWQYKLLMTLLLLPVILKCCAILASKAPLEVAR